MSDGDADRKIDIIFRYFDHDGNGLWSHAEADASRQVLTTHPLPLDEFHDLCAHVGCDPQTGLAVSDLRHLYEDSADHLERDYERVKALMNESALSTSAGGSTRVGSQAERAASGALGRTASRKSLAGKPNELSVGPVASSRGSGRELSKGESFGPRQRTASEVGRPPIAHGSDDPFSASGRVARQDSADLRQRSLLHKSAPQNERSAVREPSFGGSRVSRQESGRPTAQQGAGLSRSPSNRPPTAHGSDDPFSASGRVTRQDSDFRQRSLLHKSAPQNERSAVREPSFGGTLLSRQESGRPTAQQGASLSRSPSNRSGAGSEFRRPLAAKEFDRQPSSDSVRLSRQGTAMRQRSGNLGSNAGLVAGRSPSSGGYGTSRQDSAGFRQRSALAPDGRPEETGLRLGRSPSNQSGLPGFKRLSSERDVSTTPTSAGRLAFREPTSASNRLGRQLSDRTRLSRSPSNMSGRSEPRKEASVTPPSASRLGSGFQRLPSVHSDRLEDSRNLGRELSGRQAVREASHDSSPKEFRRGQSLLGLEPSLSKRLLTVEPSALSRQPSSPREYGEQGSSPSLAARLDSSLATRPRFDRKRVDMVSAVFRRFDADGDGFWNLKEARAARHVLAGEEMAEADYELICKDLAVDPHRGWNQAQLSALYGDNESVLAGDYQKTVAGVSFVVGEFGKPAEGDATKQLASSLRNVQSFEKIGVESTSASPLPVARSSSAASGNALSASMRSARWFRSSSEGGLQERSDRPLQPSASKRSLQSSMMAASPRRSNNREAARSHSTRSLSLADGPHQARSKSSAESSPLSSLHASSTVDEPHGVESANAAQRPSSRLEQRERESRTRSESPGTPRGSTLPGRSESPRHRQKERADALDNTVRSLASSQPHVDAAPLSMVPSGIPAGPAAAHLPRHPFRGKRGGSPPNSRPQNRANTSDSAFTSSSQATVPAALTGSSFGVKSGAPRNTSKQALVEELTRIETATSLEMSKPSDSTAVLESFAKKISRRPTTTSSPSTLGLSPASSPAARPNIFQSSTTALAALPPQPSEPVLHASDPAFISVSSPPSSPLSNSPAPVADPPPKPYNDAPPGKPPKPVHVRVPYVPLSSQQPPPPPPPPPPKPQRSASRTASSPKTGRDVGVSFSTLSGGPPPARSAPQPAAAGPVPAGPSDGPADDATFGVMVRRIFTYFDADRDGSWRFSEARRARRVLANDDFTEKEYAEVCRELGYSADGGWREELLKELYAGDRDVLREDYRKVSDLLAREDNEPPVPDDAQRNKRSSVRPNTPLLPLRGPSGPSVPQRASEGGRPQASAAGPSTPRRGDSPFTTDTSPFSVTQPSKANLLLSASDAQAARGTSSPRPSVARRDESPPSFNKTDDEIREARTLLWNPKKGAAVEYVRLPFSTEEAHRLYKERCEQCKAEYEREAARSGGGGGDAGSLLLCKEEIEFLSGRVKTVQDEFRLLRDLSARHADLGVAVKSALRYRVREEKERLALNRGHCARLARYRPVTKEDLRKSDDRHAAQQLLVDNRRKLKELLKHPSLDMSAVAEYIDDRTGASLCVFDTDELLEAATHNQKEARVLHSMLECLRDELQYLISHLTFAKQVSMHRLQLQDHTNNRLYRRYLADLSRAEDFLESDPDAPLTEYQDPTSAFADSPRVRSGQALEQYL
ncbi:hypothetical protein DIPPA_27546 [Diplonema papillatum]|nr:hypothetical protein DIPPA_27546 [Diplonema papillatum]